MTAHIVPTDEEIRFRQDMARVANTESGRAVLREIMKQCGYQKPSVVANPQTCELNAGSTFYNEGRRNLWLRLRSFISNDMLALVELFDEKPPVDDLAGV